MTQPLSSFYDPYAQPQSQAGPVPVSAPAEVPPGLVGPASYVPRSLGPAASSSAPAEADLSSIKGNLNAAGNAIGNGVQSVGMGLMSGGDVPAAQGAPDEPAAPNTPNTPGASESFLRGIRSLISTLPASSAPGTPPAAAKGGAGAPSGLVKEAESPEALQKRLASQAGGANFLANEYGGAEKNAVLRDFTSQKHQALQTGEHAANAQELQAAELVTHADEQGAMLEAAKQAEAQREQEYTAFQRKQADAQEAADKMRVDPNRYMSKKDFLQRGLMALAAGLAGFGQGLLHQSGPNPVVEQMNKNIERDIDEQKFDYEKALKKGQQIENAYSMNLKVHGTPEAAKLAAAMQANAAFNAHLQASAAQTGSQTLKDQAAAAGNDLQMKHDLYAQSLADKLAAAGAGGTGDLDKRLDLARDKYWDMVLHGAVAPPKSQGEVNEAVQRSVSRGGRFAPGSENFNPGFAAAIHPGGSDKSAIVREEAEAKAREALEKYAKFKTKMGALGPLLPENRGKMQALTSDARTRMSAAYSARNTPNAIASEELNKVVDTGTDLTGSGRAAANQALQSFNEDTAAAKMDKLGAVQVGR